MHTCARALGQAATGAAAAASCPNRKSLAALPRGNVIVCVTIFSRRQIAPARARAHPASRAQKPGMALNVLLCARRTAGLSRGTVFSSIRLRVSSVLCYNTTTLLLYEHYYCCISCCCRCRCAAVANTKHCRFKIPDPV